MKRKFGVVVLIISLIMIGVGVYFHLQDKEFIVEFIGVSNIPSVTVKEGTYLKRPDDPVKEGYKFLGWFREDNLYDFNREVTSDMVLVSKFEKIITYTVIFNSDGGSKVSSLNIEEGKTVTKPKNPTRDGYTFIEWQLNGKAYDFNSKVTSNITLKASWKKNVVKYTVKFDSVGGNNITSQTIEEGKTVIKPKTPTRVGYTFVEWQLNGKTYDFNSKVMSNITLKASWKVNPSYTVTFNSDGGSNVSNKTIIGGTKVSKPDDPIKSGYSFVEWQLDGKAYDFNAVVNSNITLKAVWQSEE